VFPDGVEITVSWNHGLSHAEIFAPSEGGGLRKKKKLCKCYCGASAGTVKESPVSEKFIFDNDLGRWVMRIDIPDQATKYKISVCQGKKGYVVKELEQVPLDFYPHRAEENFIVGSSHEEDMLYAVIQDDDVDVPEEGGGTKKVHRELEEISPCSWEVFRPLSIEFEGKLKMIEVDKWD
jgi:hypothetical protein